MKLIVVGAGIAGSCVARLARERGDEVTVIARKEPPGSLAATAILRRGYHAGKPLELQAWEWAIGCYERWGIELRRGGAVGSYRRPLDGEKADADWILLDPGAPLVKADVTREVVSAHGGRVWYGPGRGAVADAVVVAAGALGGLAAAGAVTWGVTWEHRPEALKQPDAVRVYQYAPYRTIIGGVAGGRARVGSSSAGDQERAVRQAEKMLATAWDLGWLTVRDGWELRAGARLKTDDWWWRAEDGHWGIGGFHRTGYALAPWAAARVLDEIDKVLAR